MATKILKKYKHDMPLIFNSMGHLIYTHTHTQERGGGGGVYHSIIQPQCDDYSTRCTCTAAWSANWHVCVL